ncbi:MAG TPA: glycosyltransferase family 2 protein, partial [Ignavibacteriaceae bacterium]|nr:glycosyltransferase family 2 protein [Ignavibacteriaceae bacterium]
MYTGTPLISVIITSFNLEKFIEEAIASVLNQTFQNFEIIAVDDQSTDSTPEILKRLSEKDQRIRFYSVP